MTIVMWGAIGTFRYFTKGKLSNVSNTQFPYLSIYYETSGLFHRLTLKDSTNNNFSESVLRRSDELFRESPIGKLDLRYCFRIFHGSRCPLEHIIL